jgi:hypothetical protein
VKLMLGLRDILLRCERELEMNDDVANGKLLIWGIQIIGEFFFGEERLQFNLEGIH